MTHPTEDNLLAFALEVMEVPAEQASIAAHLAVCAECAVRLTHIQREVGIIGGLRPRGRRLPMPQIRPRALRAAMLLQAAALLVIGFVLGLGAAGRTHREPAFVTPACVRLAPPPDSLQLCVVADGTDAGPASRAGLGR